MTKTIEERKQDLEVSLNSLENLYHRYYTGHVNDYGWVETNIKRVHQEIMQEFDLLLMENDSLHREIAYGFRGR